jgi:nucleotide-binding universal stress UspA family protein
MGRARLRRRALIRPEVVGARLRAARSCGPLEGVHEPDAPIVVAFDGSEQARAAVRAAAGLFHGRRLLVVSVWEVGLAMAAAAPSPDPWVPGYRMVPPEQLDAMERSQHDHATATAEAGAALARESGGAAEALAVPDLRDVASAVLEVADDHDAAAIVVGSRGLGAVGAKLLGSVSRRLLHDARRPVVVVRDPDTG